MTSSFGASNYMTPYPVKERQRASRTFTLARNPSAKRKGGRRAIAGTAVAQQTLAGYRSGTNSKPVGFLKPMIFGATFPVVRSSVARRPGIDESSGVSVYTEPTVNVVRTA